MRQLSPVLLLLLLAANMAGRVVTGLPVSPVAMACSPTGSTLAYLGTDNEYRLCSVKLGWTADTLYVDGAGIMLSGKSFGSFIDWEKYSKR